MSEKRIQFNNILQNQLPEYVREEFPLVVEFLKQYYISQEFQGAPSDLIQNIDQYLKLDTIKQNIDSTVLSSDISFADDTIPVSSTTGFPSSYGLIQIDDEIITYTSKTNTSFLGCIRGFSGITSYDNESNSDELVFSVSQSAEHSKYTNIINLSSLFLQEFFNKIKYQLSPGFENREFYSELNKYLFLKQSKDFYSTRGTNLSFKILFNVLYGEDVKIIKPQDYLIKPSDSQYEITNDLVVESISGDPYELERSTLKQDEYENISKGYASISRVEKIFTDSDKIYYKLSFDAGYNRDINVEGALYGNFSIHPKTKLIGEVNSLETTLDVDSTIGFPPQGDLFVIYEDGNQGIISYSSKNINQFLGCSNITGTILDTSDLSLNTYAYGQSNKDPNKTIKVRITSVLKQVDIVSDTYYQGKGDIGVIKTLGISPKNTAISNNWIFNNSTNFDVESIELINNIDNTYRLKTKDPNNLRAGDNIRIKSSTGIERSSVITNVISDSTIEIVGQGNLDPDVDYFIQRNLLKVDSQKYPSVFNQISNIQNIYKDGEKTLVASNSLPFYNNQPLNAFDRSIIFSGTFVGDTFTITSSQDHGFYTGDAVFYSYETDSLFDEGLYFVKRVDSKNIKLAKSRSNLYNNIFVTIENPITVSGNKIQEYEFNNKNLESQKLLRELSLPISDGGEYVTNSGSTGILVNGVEILNYKSRDQIYYGSIESVEVVNKGINYDVINPPILTVSDSVGTGATGYCAVKGSLQEIRIIDPGFDYLEVPKINITGGNGSGAKAYASMKLVDHQIVFNSELKSSVVNITNDTIGFTTYHKFRNAEKVIYKTNSQQSIGGISTNSTYYVSTKDLYTVTLHKTFDDAVSGINTISLTSYGIGNHILESYNKKSVISSINIESSGSNYENKRRTANSSGINTSLGYITIKNHDFNSGEIVKYSTSGVVIGGLINNENYYITKIDSDNFKLSQVGIGTDNLNFYYQTKQYVELISSGSGIHSFNYPEISVEIVGNTGISTNNLFKASVQPIFRGQVTSVHLENGGVGYGSSEVLNLIRNPLLTVNNGTDAKLTPIINNGKIVDVLISNPGSGYNSPPDLKISTNGNGVGAIITPILQDGKIKSIKIIQSGAGYDKNNTFILVYSAGRGCELKAKLKSWTVNLFAKYRNKITADDGYICNNPNSKYGLEYTHLYAPRKLRESVYPLQSSGKFVYGRNDLPKLNNVEISSNYHSPIIGWAYDGNPIYGPYAYSKKDGGSITQMKSGYILAPENDRPPFAEGFFIEDYQHRNVDDDSVLDEHNGRFCITPDFPKGTYAYFATLDNVSSDLFDGYKLPTFPYLIGNKFKSKPNEFNFKRSSNQDDIDLNQTKWIRNTSPYNLLKKFSSYKYLPLPNLLNQTVDIKYTSPGVIDSIGITTGGENYKVNDSIIFDNIDTNGFGLSSKVSRILGKNINNVSTASTSIYNVEIYSINGNKNLFFVQASSPHNFKNKDLISISGLNSTTSSIDGIYTIDVPQNVLSISNPLGVDDTSVTGIVTYISVSGDILNKDIRENDIFKVGSEKVKILNVDKKSSRIRILRSIDGTVGSSHSYGDILYEIPRRFNINSNNSVSYSKKVNEEIYFDPKESLGIGTVFGVGIGVTISFSNPGSGQTQIFIPTKSIYLPNHNLETGDELLYSTNSGSGIEISIDGIVSSALSDQSTVYVAKLSNDLIGISTVKVGMGSTGTFVGIASTYRSSGTLYFTGIGTGTYHSFKTNYPKLTGKVTKNVVTVSTSQTHGLTNNDNVFINITSGISTTHIVKYNEYNRRLLIDPKSFISSNINIQENSITIPNHGFKTGQKIIHTSTSPSGGLVNNKIYYVVAFDENTIKLSDTYYNSVSNIPQIINITSASSGELSTVNPPIEAYRDSTLIFDLSDSSLSYSSGSEIYSAFDMNFYIDSNFTQIFNSSSNSAIFEVQKIGKVGIDENARVTIKINKYVPQKLYYKLNPIYDDTLPTIKEEIQVDNSVLFNNEIQISESKYNGEYPITVISSSSFEYNVPEYPELNFYDTSNSLLSYETSSESAYGSISKIKILSKGQNYYGLPKFIEVVSDIGKNAILEANSNSIGKIQKTKINDIGFDYPSDFTLKPNLSLPQILKIEPLNSFDYIKVTSVGRGYTSAPKLIVIDGRTQDILSEVDLKYSLDDTYVTILNNTYRLSDVEPTILPTQNSNGVSIDTIEYNSGTKDVTVTLAVGFSTENSFPFKVNDKVLIENISVGIETTGKGFNSQNYDYQLFTITSVDENYGGYGSVTYNLEEFLGEEEYPGSYDSENSAGRIIPEKYFPKFKSVLKPNNFFENEEVRYSGTMSPIGFVENWDKNTKYLRVSSRELISEGKILEGVSSKTNGRIFSTLNFDAFINLGSYSKVEKGWTTETGILNNTLQRIQDNFYYQNFSYSLKSRVPYDTWENAVGSLNHTAGFKKFSDYQLESFNYCGIATDSISNIDVTTDIDGFASLNCVYDFDLASENSLIVGSQVISDEITFASRIITDYFESIGNRVLSIDDISGYFNSNPRAERFSVVHRFPLTDARAQKYITYVTDRRYINQKQSMIVTLLHDNSIGYLNQYARIESVSDLGSFDFKVEGPDGLLLFYPTKYKVNNYDVMTLSYNVKDNFAGIGSTNLGGIVNLNTNTTFASSGPTTIVGVGSTYTSLKVLVEISADTGEYEFDELNLVHDGTNVEFINYGQLSNHSVDAYSNSGLGTYYAYLSGSDLKIDFTPNVGIAATISTIQVAIANTSVSGIGTYDIKYARFEARSTSIASSTSPTSTVIAEYPDNYNGGYFVVQVSDITNNAYQLSELIVLNAQNETYYTEFANLETYSTLGTISVGKSTSSVQLTFIPIPDIDVDVKVYFNTITNFDNVNTISQYNNSTATTDYGIYYGTEKDVKREFELKHKGYPIFRKYFDASNSSVVSIASSTIKIQNHFFTTGEEIVYSYDNEAIGIGATYFGVGIGTTDKLPLTAYVIKIDENTFRLARSAEDALRIVPKFIDITSVGIGTSHVFTSTKQNAKALISIDNVIQSPIVSTATTAKLSADFIVIEDVLYADDVDNFFINDLIKIDDEIMKVESVGVGSTNSIRVIRPWLGTVVENHSSNSLITKVIGNYNIVDNIINFVDAPYGNIPLGTTTNPPDERDWLGISTGSSFHGRTFMRSGISETSNEAYYKNYVFDDISDEFDGIQKVFSLTSEGSNIEDISQENAILMINDIFQGPGLNSNYTLSESGGVVSASFVGSATSLPSDINTSDFPSGGIIVSVGSTEGFGYQPLVAAGGTAIVSAAGTIASISIGNSGSGYRSQIQTLSGAQSVIVKVGVITSSTGTSSIEFIGTASISNGNIVSIAITNPGFGYTSSNPPQVIIDDPISYSDIPLIYSPSSSGVGTQATINVTVGQGSSVIDFEIKNIGYGYEVGDILTLPISGNVGIPTIANSSLKEFQITVQETFTDKFTGWSIGEIQPLDKIENLFNGKRVVFPLKYLGERISIYAKKGSTINIQDNLLIFINDILQIPGEGYIFNGGSKIRFTEAPKSEDVCKILFYKGSGEGVDVIFRNIIETVKIGDDLTLTYDPFVGQSAYYLEDPRYVTDILSIDSVETNPYFGPGNTPNEALRRPIIWCRQTEDKIINELEVSKDRMLYEPLIYPSSYLIQPVGVGTTIVFVESIRPFFNPTNENYISLDFQKNITFISQDVKVSASATAIVSIAGTISSINITNGGSGYTIAPTVSIQRPIGNGTTFSTAISSINLGIVDSITVIGVVTGYSENNPPAVLIEPPTPQKEENKVNSYSGDFGIISGISTTSVGVASTGIVFDFVIPANSYLRDSSVAGVTTISGIQTGYYFVISNSNVGNGVTSLNSFGSIVGVGTSFLDGVYQVASVSIAQTSVVGYGITYVAKVTVSISDYNGLSGIGYSNYYGNYSWGRIVLNYRTKENYYNAYTNNGYSGISTGTILHRTSPLKYLNYNS